MPDTKYLETMGWSGPPLQTLVGRDLTLTEKGESRRGPLININSKPIFSTRSLILSFYVDWVALKVEYSWLLEDDSPRLACVINTETFKVQTQVDSSLRFWKAIIHPAGDNLIKPEIPVLHRRVYIADYLKDWV